MPANNLQGLNIVHPVQDNHDSQDLLGYPDISAQLDLWTNLAFESDEPLAHRHDDSKTSAKSNSEDEEEESRSPVSGENAVRDGHVNVVTPTNVVVNPAQSTSNGSIFDFNSFLAGFGLDAFNAHQVPLPQQQQQHQHHQLPPAPLAAPSLAQLLALHPNQAAMFTHPAMPHFIPSMAAAAAARSIPNPAAMAQAYARGPPQPSAPTTAPVPIASEESHIPAKKARTRKPSVDHYDPSEYHHEEDPSSPTDSISQHNGAPLSAAEDKRRRNTAASARFRLKKKEREQALEGRAKELEAKVTELERECEGLRRENGWLKGLVVGVTGAAQSTNGATGLSVNSPPPGPISTGTKRRRDDESI